MNYATEIIKRPQEKNLGAKYYGVRKGRTVSSCIFLFWQDCKDEVDGVVGAEYCALDDLEKAAEFAMPLSHPVRIHCDDAAVSATATTIAQCHHSRQKEMEDSSSATILTNSADFCWAPFPYDGDDQATLSENGSVSKKKTNAPYRNERNIIVKQNNSGNCCKLQHKNNLDGHYDPDLLDSPVKHIEEKNNEKKRKLSDDSDLDRKEDRKQIKKSCQYEGKLNQIWEEKYDLFKKFKEENGHCHVPKSHEIYQWSCMQRFKHKQLQKGKPTTLTESRIKKLTDLGFNLVQRDDPNECEERSNQIWEDKFELLKHFKEEVGHCDLPIGHEIYGWANKQRWKYKELKKGKPVTLSTSKIKKLVDLGFKLKEKMVNDQNWEDNYENLKKYKEENGSCHLPPKGYIKLKGWIHTQRTQYRALKNDQPSKLTASRIGKLTDLGLKLIVKETKNFTWEERMEQLDDFKKAHSHSRIPLSDPLLGVFVRNVRKRYARMDETRIRQLTEWGFVFQAGKKPRPVDPLMRKTWEERFKELLEFKAKFGHTRVPQIYKPNLTLGTWVHGVGLIFF